MISSFLLMIDEEMKISCEYKSKLLASKNELLKQIFLLLCNDDLYISFGILHFIFEHLKSNT